MHASAQVRTWSGLAMFCFWRTRGQQGHPEACHNEEDVTSCGGWWMLWGGDGLWVGLVHEPREDKEWWSADTTSGVMHTMEQLEHQASSICSPVVTMATISPLPAATRCCCGYVVQPAACQYSGFYEWTSSKRHWQLFYRKQSMISLRICYS